MPRPVDDLPEPNSPASDPQPLADVLVAQSDREGQRPYARFTRRAAAGAIDAAAFVAVWLVLEWAYRTVPWDAWSWWVWQPHRYLIPTVISGGSALTVTVVPSLLLKSAATPTTFGKWLLGIQATDRNGRPLGWSRAVGRIAARLAVVLGVVVLTDQALNTLPMLQLVALAMTTLSLIGHLLPLFTPQRQALHDLVAGTLVVKS